MQKEWSTPMQSTNARIEVFMEMKIKVEVFLVVMPCSVVVGYQHFRGSFCPHLHPEDEGGMVKIKAKVF